MSNEQILQRIMKDYSGVVFVESTKSWWDPQARHIYYNPTQQNAVWSLLHEIGHMHCEHNSYGNDLELVKMEAEAWAVAKTLAQKYTVEIDAEYVEDCLDSYRDWLHKRSTCPRCTQTGLQRDDATYKCVNCQEQWRVSKSRFCRSYRINTKTPK